YLALPAEIKRKYGWGRYILRKSMEGLLPPEIQWRNDKVGTTIPNVFVRLKHDYEQIKSLIHRARKEEINHYIDYDKALEMLDKVAFRSKNTKGRTITNTLLSAISLLLYQLEEY
ncbi:MAG: asparagine synthase-related protein, partial [Bacteroidales bacterium]